MRRKLAYFLTGGMFLAFLFARGIKKETYSDQKVVVGDYVTPFLLISAHASPRHWLTVKGKTFNGLYGSKPYYLDVPTLNSMSVVR
jgi:hypothetical protein